jgi:hypothetical protein
LGLCRGRRRSYWSAPDGWGLFVVCLRQCLR